MVPGKNNLANYYTKHFDSKTMLKCKLYGKRAQDPIQIDKSRINVIQQVVGGVLYNVRAVDNTVLVALGAIVSEQTIATVATEGKILQLLDYLASKPSTTVRFHASDMVLNIHSDASYLSETTVRSRVAGHVMLRSKPVNGKLIKMNGAVYVFCGIFLNL